MADPVRARRARAAVVARAGARFGYGLYAAAAVLFFIGLVRDFTSGLATGVITCLVAGSVLLAPAIILGFAVRAAEREDRERGM